MQRLYMVSNSSLETKPSRSSSTSYRGKDGVSLDLNNLDTYPDDELDVGAGWSASKELKGAGNVHGADLVMVVGLGSVSSAKEVEHTVQLLLLNGLDFDGLEDLGGARLQLVHNLKRFF